MKIFEIFAKMWPTYYDEGIHYAIRSPTAASYNVMHTMTSGMISFHNFSYFLFFFIHLRLSPFMTVLLRSLQTYQYMLLYI